MENLADIAIERELSALCSRADADFAALAGLRKSERQAKWEYLWGSRSLRTRQMTVASGIGLAGMAIRHGSVCRIDSLSGLMKPADCPVMLAEHLKAAAAFALVATGGLNPEGILFIGRRTDKAFSDDEITAVAQLVAGIKKLYLL
ncbi:hypothetical protein [Paenibacillus nasutitermitis]|uniref:GAF domain-containing protein n=1 Tax=Paenibacillus nasutitermitis TaxID=1652958 RepID=A0A917DNM8_9BACL|nr:hypothetical protein [Paenibacillus nasutitermitis]GGD55420.1 hypothetical protein GCM10010911_11360 [Paenibacillus nasutitermitis]